MDKYINRLDKPKKPIGQKHRPVKSSDYEPREDVSVFMRRMGIKGDE